MSTPKFLWKKDQDLGNNRVNATIYSDDNELQLRLTSIPGGLADNITQLVNAAYNRGLENVPEPVVKTVSETTKVKKLKQELMEKSEEILNLREKVEQLEEQLSATAS